MPDPARHTFFHQTTRWRAQQIKWFGFRIKPEHSKSDHIMPLGVFIKPTDEHIALYLPSDSYQLPVKAMVKNVLELEDRTALRNFLLQDEKFSELDQQITKLENSFPPFPIKELRPQIAAARKKLEELYPICRAHVRDLMTSRGYDGLFLRKDEGRWKNFTTTLVVFDTKKVKAAKAT